MNWIHIVYLYSIALLSTAAWSKAVVATTTMKRATTTTMKRATTTTMKRATTTTSTTTAYNPLAVQRLEDLQKSPTELIQESKMNASDFIFDFGNATTGISNGTGGHTVQATVNSIYK
ncbi:unnamed protein product, partial [Didymodactylos carnosus]